MRTVVLAGLVLVALAVALWVSVSGEPEAAVTTEHHAAKPKEETPEARPTQAPTRTATIPTPQKKAHPQAAPMPVDDRPPPPTMEAGSGSAKPADPVRDTLAEQVMYTEGAVAECVDNAKKAGELVDGQAAFGFYLGRQNGKVVVERVTTEYGPAWPATFNDCVAKAGNTVAVDSLPENMEHVAVFRGVRIANGQLRKNTLLNYEVVEKLPD